MDRPPLLDGIVQVSDAVVLPATAANAVGAEAIPAGVPVELDAKELVPAALMAATRKM